MTRCEEQPPLASTPHHLEGTPGHREAQRVAGAHQRLLMLRVRGQEQVVPGRAQGALESAVEGSSTFCMGCFSHSVCGLVIGLQDGPGSRTRHCVPGWGTGTSVCACKTCSASVC